MCGALDLPSAVPVASAVLRCLPCYLLVPILPQLLVTVKRFVLLLRSLQPGGLTAAGYCLIWFPFYMMPG